MHNATSMLQLEEFFRNTDISDSDVNGTFIDSELAEDESRMKR